MGFRYRKDRRDWQRLGVVTLVVALFLLVLNASSVSWFFSRLHRGIRIAFYDPQNREELPQENPAVVHERRIQETRQFLRRLRDARQEYVRLWRELDEHNMRGRFGDSGFPYGLARQWSERRNHYQLGYTEEDLARLESDFTQAASAHQLGEADDTDEEVIPLVHRYTGQLLGIPFDERTQRFAANLAATDRDAPEIVVEEFRIILKRAGGPRTTDSSRTSNRDE